MKKIMTVIALSTLTSMVYTPIYGVDEKDEKIEKSLPSISEKDNAFLDLREQAKTDLGKAHEVALRYVAWAEHEPTNETHKKNALYWFNCAASKHDASALANYALFLSRLTSPQNVQAFNLVVLAISYTKVCDKKYAGMIALYKTLLHILDPETTWPLVATKTITTKGKTEGEEDIIQTVEVPHEQRLRAWLNKQNNKDSAYTMAVLGGLSNVNVTDPIHTFGYTGPNVEQQRKNAIAWNHPWRGNLMLEPEEPGLFEWAASSALSAASTALSAAVSAPGVLVVAAHTLTGKK